MVDVINHFHEYREQDKYKCRDVDFGLGEMVQKLFMEIYTIFYTYTYYGDTFDRLKYILEQTQIKRPDIYQKKIINDIIEALTMLCYYCYCHYHGQDHNNVMLLLLLLCYYYYCCN